MRSPRACRAPPERHFLCQLSGPAANPAATIRLGANHLQGAQLPGSRRTGTPQHSDIVRFLAARSSTSPTGATTRGTATRAAQHGSAVQGRVVFMAEVCQKNISLSSTDKKKQVDPDKIPEKLCQRANAALPRSAQTQEPNVDFTNNLRQISGTGSERARLSPTASAWPTPGHRPLAAQPLHRR
jgi:hypothetical protein